MPTEDDSPEGAAVARALEKPEAEDRGIPVEPPGNETARERAARIATLREQIAQGTYKPDARKLAAKMVDANLKRER
jgi:anti-sigma28 factor (negative regulator of flagellin synthesis)